MKLLGILNIDMEDGIIDEISGDNNERKQILNEITMIVYNFRITLESLRSASISRQDSVSAIKFKYEELIDNLVPLMQKLDCEYVYKNIDVTKDIKIRFKFNDNISYILKIDKKYRIKIYKK